MTAYLARKNLQARVKRIAERIFEVFISNLDLLPSVCAALCFGGMVLWLVIGLADLACLDPEFIAVK